MMVESLSDSWSQRIEYGGGDVLCLAIPGRIIKLEGVFAIVDIMSFQSEVFISLIEDAAAGDYVLVHAGCAIERINEKEYDQISDFSRVFMEEQV